MTRQHCAHRRHRLSRALASSGEEPAAAASAGVVAPTVSAMRPTRPRSRRPTVHDAASKHRGGPTPRENVANCCQVQAVRGAEQKLYDTSADRKKMLNTVAMHEEQGDRSRPIHATVSIVNGARRTRGQSTANPIFKVPGRPPSTRTTSRRDPGPGHNARPAGEGGKGPRAWAQC